MLFTKNNLKIPKLKGYVKERCSEKLQTLRLKE